MHGTQLARFSADVLQRGAEAVLPQHLPDRWLDALMQEAEGFKAREEDREADDAEEGDPEDEGIAGLLAAVLVLVSAQRGDPPELEIPTDTLMDHFTCYIMALAAELVSRRTDIWIEPSTVANIFDTARAVRVERRLQEDS